MFWWEILALAATVFFALLGVLHWVLTEPDAGRDTTKDRFRLEQEYREFRRVDEITSR